MDVNSTCGHSVEHLTDAIVSRTSCQGCGYKSQETVTLCIQCQLQGLGEPPVTWLSTCSNKCKLAETWRVLDFSAVGHAHVTGPQGPLLTSSIRKMAGGRGRTLKRALLVMRKIWPDMVIPLLSFLRRVTTSLWR